MRLLVAASSSSQHHSPGSHVPMSPVCRSLYQLEAAGLHLCPAPSRCAGNCSICRAPSTGLGWRDGGRAVGGQLLAIIISYRINGWSRWE